MSHQSTHKSRKRDLTFESIASVSQTSHQPSNSKPLPENLQNQLCSKCKHLVIEKSRRKTNKTRPQFQGTQQQFDKSSTTLRFNMPNSKFTTHLKNLQHIGMGGNSLIDCDNGSEYESQVKFQDKQVDYQKRKSQYLMKHFKPKKKNIKSRTDLMTQKSMKYKNKKHQQINSHKQSLCQYNTLTNFQGQQNQQNIISPTQKNNFLANPIEDPFENYYEHQYQDMECVRNFEKYLPHNNLDHIIKIINEKRRKKMLDFIQKSNYLPTLSIQHRLTILTFQKIEPQLTKCSTKIGSINFDSKAKQQYRQWRPSSIYFEQQKEEEKEEEVHLGKPKPKPKSQFGSMLLQQ